MPHVAKKDSELSLQTTALAVAVAVIAAGTGACVLPEVTSADGGCLDGKPCSMQVCEGESCSESGQKTRAVQTADSGRMDASDLQFALDGSSKPAADGGNHRPTEVAAPAPVIEASMDGGAPAQRPRASDAKPAMSAESMMQMEPQKVMFWDHWLWPVPDATPRAKHAPNHTVSGNTVVDNVTKLAWQRSRPAAYQGCTASLDGPQGSACTQDEARAYCKSTVTAAALGGSGWRLPQMSELTTLWDPTRLEIGGDKLGIDLSVFPDTAPGNYWTDNSPAGAESGAVADFSVTSLWLGSIPRTQGARVRCVRSMDIEMTESLPHFRVGAGTVAALHTSLTWQQVSSTATYDWQGAIRYCQSLDLDGSGWRLPAIKELLSLVEDEFKSFDPEFFPDEKKYPYWSSSELRANYPVDQPWVWNVHFNGGNASAGTADGQNWVRCVR